MFVFNSSRRLITLCSVLFLCASCGGGGGSSVASNSALETASLDTSDRLFKPDALLRVEIEMAPADYEALRTEGRSIADLLAGCAADFEYTHFPASVSVDGKRIDDVDIRKKGFFGSLSSTRPSFKLNFETLRPGREFESLERLTLNNNNQDPGNTHQCITYDLFRRAGLPAPRCNFARVTMNGEDLGIYSNIESLDRGFMRRNFADGTGNIYEGQIDGDFGENTQHNLQQKNNFDSNDRSDLAAVVNALNADDANLPGLLEQVVDVDEFLTYWAMESITGHWDSYTGNANNFFMYKNPADGLFHFIPWGTDGALQLEGIAAFPYNGPLFRYTEIPSRLYAIPEYRQRFETRVGQLLDELWDEAAFNREIDRIRDLTGTAEADLEQVREFFALYEPRVRASLAGELVQLERTIGDVATVCMPPVETPISGTFAGGVGTMEYTDAQGEVVSVVGSASPLEISNNAPIGEGPSITIVGAGRQGLRIALISVDPDELQVGEVSFQGIRTTLFLVGPQGEAGFGLIGIIGEGSLVFEEEPVIGQPLTGSFAGTLLLFEGGSLGALGGAQ